MDCSFDLGRPVIVGSMGMILYRRCSCFLIILSFVILILTFLFWLRENLQDVMSRWHYADTPFGLCLPCSTAGNISRGQKEG